MLAYETNSTFLSNAIVAIGYARLTGSLNVTTSGLIQACNSYCSNTYQPSVAVDISLGNYMIVFETQPVGTTSNSFLIQMQLNVYFLDNALAVWVITPSNSQSYQDGVSYAYVLPGTNTTYILSEQTPELVFASNNGSFALVFQAIVNQNAPPSLSIFFIPLFFLIIESHFASSKCCFSWKCNGKWNCLTAFNYSCFEQHWGCDQLGSECEIFQWCQSLYSCIDYSIS